MTNIALTTQPSRLHHGVGWLSVRGTRLVQGARSVRGRASAVACLVVALAVVAGASTLLVLLRHSLVGAVDTTATLRAKDVAALARQGALPPTISVPEAGDALVQVVDSHGLVIASSANLARREPITGVRPQDDGPTIRTVSGLPTDRGASFRLVALRTATPQGPVSVYVALDLDRVNATLGKVRQLIAVGIPALFALAGIATWILIAWALRPVAAMRSQLETLSARALDRRIPEPPIEDEVGQLARTMNALLHRLEASSQEQGRFVAHASHELKNPLATAQLQLEDALARPDDANWPQIAADLLEEQQRMSRLVHDLLFLARADHTPVTASALRGVDLEELTFQEARRLGAHSPIVIDTTQVGPTPIPGDEDQLRRVIRNLLENAERYAFTTVTVELTADDHHVELVVHDDGAGIAPADRDRIFERFTQLNNPPGRRPGGSGLGLSIVREIVHGHGGTITVEDSSIGARFVVRLPA